MTIHAISGNFVPGNTATNLMWTAPPIIVPFVPTHIRTLCSVRDRPPAEGGLGAAAVINRVQLEWFSGMDSGSYFQRSQRGTIIEGIINGFFVTPFGPFELGKAVTTGTLRTLNNQVQIMQANHSVVTGDILRITNATDNRSIAGLDYTVGQVVTGPQGTFNLLGLPGAAVGTTDKAVVYRKVMRRPLFGPVTLPITNLTAGRQTVVTVTPDYPSLRFNVDQIVRLSVPPGWGLRGLDGISARIVSITRPTTGASTDDTGTLGLKLTLDYDSTGAGTFAFPSSTAIRVSFAQVIPVGQTGFSSESAFTNVDTQGASVQFGRAVYPLASPNRPGLRRVFWEITGYPEREIQTTN